MTKSAGLVTKNKLNLFAWWRLDYAAIEYEAKNYKDMKFLQTYRGISIACILFSASLTTCITLFLAKPNILIILEIAIWLALAYLIYKEKKCAVSCAILLWTADIVGSIVTTNGHQALVQIIFYGIYMHYFYSLYKVDSLRGQSK